MTLPGLPPDFPPVLYVPCLDHVQDAALAEIEYRPTKDGRMALLVYSALDRLHDMRGNDQPWIVLATTELVALYETRPFDVVYLDVYVPEDRRRERVS